MVQPLHEKCWGIMVSCSKDIDICSKDMVAAGRGEMVCSGVAALIGVCNCAADARAVLNCLFKVHGMLRWDGEVPGVRFSSSNKCHSAGIELPGNGNVMEWEGVISLSGCSKEGLGGV